MEKTEKAAGQEVHSSIEQLFTVPAAARRLGVGERQLRRAIGAGELDTYEIGKWTRVMWGDVLRWARSKRAVPPTSHAQRRVAEILAREGRKSL